MARLVFDCQDSEGYRVRFETSEKEGSELVASYQACKKWLLKNGFALTKASNGEARSKEGASGVKYRFDGHHCPRCDGAVWDNRQKKREDPAKNRWPDFSCRDKADCKWAAWPGQYEIVDA